MRFKKLVWLLPPMEWLSGFHRGLLAWWEERRGGGGWSIGTSMNHGDVRGLKASPPTKSDKFNALCTTHTFWEFSCPALSTHCADFSQILSPSLPI